MDGNPYSGPKNLDKLFKRKVQFGTKEREYDASSRTLMKGYKARMNKIQSYHFKSIPKWKSIDEGMDKQEKRQGNGEEETELDDDISISGPPDETCEKSGTSFKKEQYRGIQREPELKEKVAQLKKPEAEMKGALPTSKYKLQEEKEEVKYKLSWSKFQMVKTPSVIVRDWHKPEKYEDATFLAGETTGKTPQITAKCEIKIKGDKEKLDVPWRELLKLPELKETSKISIKPDQMKTEYITKLPQIKTPKVREDELRELNEAKYFLTMTLEDSEEEHVFFEEQGEEPVRRVAFEDDKKEIQKMRKLKKVKDKKSKATHFYEPLMKQQKEQRQEIGKEIEKEFEDLQHKLSVSSSEELNWRMSTILKEATSKSAIDYETTLTENYLKRLTEESPFLESPTDMAGKGDEAAIGDEFSFSIMKIANKMFKKLAEGDTFEMDIIKHICTKKVGKIDTVLLDELLSRIEDITKVEDKMKAKLLQIQEMQEMEKWDENYAYYLKNYLKSDTDLQKTNADIKSKLHSVLKNIDLLQSDYNENVLEPNASVPNENNTKFSIGCEVAEFKVDQSVLCKASNNMTSKRRESNSQNVPRSTAHHVAEQWCPKANFVYTYTEDLNPVKRVLNFENEISKQTDLNSSSEEVYSIRPKYEGVLEWEDPYDEELAEIKYLKSKPTCFIIFGKEGVNSRGLAEMIASYWGCIVVDADSVVESVLKSGTKVADRLDSTLRTGNKIPSNVIFSLILERLQCNDLNHYGYVLIGLPYTVSDEADPSPTKQLKTIFTLSLKPDAVIYIMCPDRDVHYRRHLQRFDANTGKYISNEMQDLNTEMNPLYEKDKDPNEKTSEVSQMVNEKVKISEALLNKDAVKRTNDFPHSVDRDLKFYRDEVLQAIEHIVLQLDPQYVIRADGRSSTVQMFQVVKAKLLTLPIQRTYVPVKMVPDSAPQLSKSSNASEKASEEEEKEDDISSVDKTKELTEDERSEEEWVLNEDDLNEIELNEEELAEAFIDDQLQKEVTIEDLFTSKADKYPQMSEDVSPDDEFAEEEDDSFQFYRKRSAKDCFQRLSRKDSLGTRFRWHISHWNYTCPVALKEGRRLQGLPQFAVRFLDKLYFLSSPEALDTFIENPRPYLLPPNPMPTCRYFIMGPTFSGKTALAMYLAKIFHGKVISCKELCNESVEFEQAKIVELHRTSIVNDAISTVSEQEQKEFDINEEERLQAIEEWKNDTLYLLGTFIAASEKTGKSDESNGASKDSEASSLQLSSSASSSSLGYTNAEIISILAERNIPCTDNLELAQELLEDTEKLMDYLPGNLKEAPPIDENHPEVVKYIDEAVKKLKAETPATVNMDYVAILMTQAIYDAEKEYAAKTHQTLKHGGWVIDDVPPDVTLFTKLKEFGIVPDAVICLRDEDEEHTEILSRWTYKIPDYDDLIRSQFPVPEQTVIGEYDDLTPRDIELSKPRNHIFLSILDLLIYPKTKSDEDVSCVTENFIESHSLISEYSSKIKVPTPTGSQDSTIDSDLAILSMLFLDDDSGTDSRDLEEKMFKISTAEQSLSCVNVEPGKAVSLSTVEKMVLREVDTSTSSAQFVYPLHSEFESLEFIEDFGRLTEDEPGSIVDAFSEKEHVIIDYESEPEEKMETTSEIDIQQQRNLFPKGSILKTADQSVRHSQGGTSLVIFAIDDQKEELHEDNTEELERAKEAVLKELQLFDAAYDAFKTDMADTVDHPVEIDIRGKTITNIMKETVTRIEDLFCMRPQIVDVEEDEEEEEEDREEDEHVEEEISEFGEEASENQPSTVKKEPNLGDTKSYCPVKFKKNFVLCPGKKTLKVKFHNKIYYLSDEEAMNEFLANPRSFAPYRNPSKLFPPLRICIVGPIGSGKSVVGQLLSRRLGVPYVNYRTLVENYGPQRIGHKHEDSYDVPEEGEDLDENDELINQIRKYLNEGTPLPDHCLEQIVTPLWSSEKYKNSGFVLDGFPHGLEDAAFIKDSAAFPDIIIELQVSAEAVVERVFQKYVERWSQRLNMKKKRFISEVVRNEEVRKKRMWCYALYLLAQKMVESEQALEAEEAQSSENGSTNNQLEGADEAELEEPEKPTSSNDTKESVVTNIQDQMLKYHVLIDNIPIAYTVNNLEEVQYEQPLPLYLIKLLQHKLSDVTYTGTDYETLIPALKGQTEVVPTSSSDEATVQQILGTMPEIPSDKSQTTKSSSDTDDLKNGTYTPESQLSWDDSMTIEDAASIKERIQSFSHEADSSYMSLMAIKSLMVYDDIKYLRFISNENLYEWFDNQENQEEINTEIAETVMSLYPPENLEKEWESTADAKKRIKKDILTWYETEVANLEIIKERTEEYYIPWIQLEAEKPSEEIVNHIVHITSKYRHKSESLFESTCEISVQEAEFLLNCGYYFISKFGFWCPVQVAEKEIPIQIYVPNEEHDDIYPLIHRQYIYFTAGKENMNKFCKDPLFYIKQDPYRPLFPVRVAIIGPPKCGKSTLAQRLAHFFGLKVITAGGALRYVLEEMAWTQLASHIQGVLREGLTVPDKLIVKAIEAASIDPRCVTKGLILDAFPNTIPQIQELAKQSLTPFLIICLQSDIDHCVDRLTRMKDEDFRVGFKYSVLYMTEKYKEWEECSGQLHSWVKEEYANIIYLDGTDNRWQLFAKANKEIFRIMKSINTYLKNVNHAAVSLEGLCVTSEEFNDRRHSQFQNYCPVCLKDDEVMMKGQPILHKGLVQYKKFFYWVCERHCEKFVQDPETYTPPSNDAHLSACIPESVNINQHPEGELFADGYCIVTYLNKQPRGRLVQGSPSFALKYKDKIYLLCSEDCQNEFMKKPESFINTEIHFRNADPLPPLCLSALPPMGYLEQTLYSQIKNAVTYVVYKRPKYPALDAKISAAICIGLFLKVHNDKLPLEIVKRYETANQHFCDSLDFMKSVLDIMASRPNIYASQKPVYTQPADEDAVIDSQVGEERRPSSTSTKSEYGPCGYVYPTMSKDFYPGDYYAKLPAKHSSSESM